MKLRSFLTLLATSSLLASTLLLGSCSKKQQEEAADDANPAQTGYQETSVGSGGTISGIVSYNGATNVQPIEIQRDQEVCGASHPNPAAPGNGSGVKGVLVYLEKISAGKPWDGIKASGDLDQHGCEFVPHIQLIKKGGKLLVSNSDKALHNVHAKINDNTVFNEAQPDGAPPREFEMTKVGVNTVNCDVHPWMRGFIVVADHPYYTLTDSTGKFEMTGVPAGTYNVRVWRDNWAIDQAKDPRGRITTYSWRDDFSKQQQVTVAQQQTSSVNFSLP